MNRREYLGLLATSAGASYYGTQSTGDCQTETETESYRGIGFTLGGEHGATLGKH